MDVTKWIHPVILKRFKWGMIGSREGDDMYKNQEKKLIWLAFIVAAIMLLSILGRIFGS